MYVGSSSHLFCFIHHTFILMLLPASLSYISMHELPCTFTVSAFFYGMLTLHFQRFYDFQQFNSRQNNRREWGWVGMSLRKNKFDNNFFSMHNFSLMLMHIAHTNTHLSHSHTIWHKNIPLKVFIVHVIPSLLRNHSSICTCLA